MADQIGTLKRRIDAAARERATLEERQRRAREDKADAERKLRELGLEPETASAQIESDYDALEQVVSAIEEQLGL